MEVTAEREVLVAPVVRGEMEAFLRLNGNAILMPEMEAMEAVEAMVEVAAADAGVTPMEYIHTMSAAHRTMHQAIPSQVELVEPAVMEGTLWETAVHPVLPE
jgi:hypothetical protein